MVGTEHCCNVGGFVLEVSHFGAWGGVVYNDIWGMRILCNSCTAYYYIATLCVDIILRVMAGTHMMTTVYGLETPTRKVDVGNFTII